MKDYIKIHPWKIIEEGFQKEHNEISESLFSLGNGKTGLRGNFEEHYSGPTLQGSYNAGIYYPDKTKVGWWKNGYPEYFAKVLNSCNWIGLDINFGGFQLDLNTMEVAHFRRELDMQKGILNRSFDASSEQIKISAETLRITSMHDDEVACLKYSLTNLNFEGKINIQSYLDFDIVNQDSNYDEKFWEEVSQEAEGDYVFVQSQTLKTGFNLGLGLVTQVSVNNSSINPTANSCRSKFAASEFTIESKPGDQIDIYKYVSFGSSLYYDENEIPSMCRKKAYEACEKSWQKLSEDHFEAWAEIWKLSDIIIEGDDSAQQGIRFNIFHLKQTYTGKDSRLNIGPKGFTGEKYGGSTYWDTEAYCLPFYQSTSAKEVSLQLLRYRYNHLPKAIENANKLGFSNGAALYPMVTMNGEECHNEWEITFEEIHRNGAIAYAIYDYINYNNDDSYLQEGGLAVLIGIARFWAQRVNYSEAKKQYVMLGVTGPNEYENNVNNNWYTNYIAQWCLKYTIEWIINLKESNPGFIVELYSKLNFQDSELDKWQKIINDIYLPFDEERNIFLQQEGFLDKELILVKDLSEEDRPLNQKWSWDRILRSVYIKQADVLQGIYFFEDDFSYEEIESNFNFYEPFTVHESSLSPCVHSILACKLGKIDKAYEMYLRTSRLDLDDYNNDTEDGLHITSMAGTWMSVVKGFSGMRIKGNHLHFNPLLPKHWQTIEFKVVFQDNLLKVKINKAGTEVFKEQGELDRIFVNEEEIML